MCFLHFEFVFLVENSFICNRINLSVLTYLKCNMSLTFESRLIIRYRHILPWKNPSPCTHSLSIIFHLFQHESALIIIFVIKLPSAHTFFFPWQVYKASDVCRLCWRWATFWLGRMLWQSNWRLLHRSYQS